MKDEEMMAVVEDGIKQVSDKVNEKYQVIINGGEVSTPVLDDVFENMKEAGTVAVVATDIFTLPLVESGVSLTIETKVKKSLIVEVNAITNNVTFVMQHLVILT